MYYSWGNYRYTLKTHKDYCFHNLHVYVFLCSVANSLWTGRVIKMHLPTQKKIRVKKTPPACDLSSIQQLNKTRHCTLPVQSSPPIELKPFQQSKFWQISSLTQCLSTCCTWLSVGKTWMGYWPSLPRPYGHGLPWCVWGRCFRQRPIVWCQRSWGGGDYMYTRTHSRSQNTHQQTAPEHNSTLPVSLQFHPPSRCF